MVSHRSGETEDVTIADISVGLRAGQIVRKTPRNARLTPSESRRPVPLGAPGQVQPAHPHRGGARQQRRVRGAQLQDRCPHVIALRPVIGLLMLWRTGPVSSRLASNMIYVSRVSLANLALRLARVRNVI